jgi:hypothetical protein
MQFNYTIIIIIIIIIIKIIKKPAHLAAGFFLDLLPP